MSAHTDHQSSVSPDRIVVRDEHGCTRIGQRRMRACALLTALLMLLATGTAAAQGSFQEGDLYFNQSWNSNPGSPPRSAVGLAKLDSQSCGATALSPGLIVQSHAKYDPFRDAIVGLAYASGSFQGTKRFHSNGAVSNWNVTGTVQGSMTALAPRGDGIVYAVSYVPSPTGENKLGYVDQSDVFHPLLNLAGGLIDIPFYSSAYERDLMYSAVTNSLVYIAGFDATQPCTAQGWRVWWVDLDAAGTGLRADPIIQNFPTCGTGGRIFTRMARTQDDTFVFVTLTNTTVAQYEIVELKPATKSKGTFGFIDVPVCASSPVSVGLGGGQPPGMGLAFDRRTQQVIAAMYRSTCGTTCPLPHNYELRSFMRSATPDAGVLVCAFPSYDPCIPTYEPWGVSDMFDISSPPALLNSYCTAGTSTNACLPSISATAPPSASLAHASNISIANVEGQKFGIVFYGIDNAGFAPSPWSPASTSWLCIKSPAQRTNAQNSNGTAGLCDGSFNLDWNAYQSANPLALGNPFSVGDHVYVQAWYRDPLAPKTTNLSNALDMTMQP